jgi:hypothetical protein
MLSSFLIFLATFRIRAVLHHQISESDVQYALSCFKVTDATLLSIYILLISNGYSRTET